MIRHLKRDLNNHAYVWHASGTSNFATIVTKHQGGISSGENDSGVGVRADFDVPVVDAGEAPGWIDLEEKLRLEKEHPR